LPVKQTVRLLSAALQPAFSVHNVIGTFSFIVAGFASLTVLAQTAALAPTPDATPAPAAQVPAVPIPPPAFAPAGPRFVVVLNAAHGGDEPGGKLASLAEKDYTLALSVRLRSLLTARGVQVVTMRESDVAVDANRRAEIANHASAQACLSLHATKVGSGIHLFASSLAPVQVTRVSAWKTAQAAWVTRSLALAGVLNSALVHAGLSVTLGRTALPGIDSMACPAIAIELAPDLPPGGKKTDLDDPAYQARVTEALAAALLEWKTEGRLP
jgi:N-acetylmuramoyl-L-alanine amidase